jgi:hypothetical protein
MGSQLADKHRGIIVTGGAGFILSKFVLFRFMTSR